MILDRLADLRTLAASAFNTSDTMNEDAAYADIEQHVTQGLSYWSGLGIASEEHLQRLTDGEKRAVNEAAALMKQTLEDLGQATDDELRTLATESGEQRGRLSAISRNARGLRAQLLVAQQALLRRLARNVWAEDDLLRLDLLAHRRDDSTAADIASNALDVQERLMAEVANESYGLSLHQLNALVREAEEAANAADVLRDESIDDGILGFWQVAFSEDGVPLTMLTPEILTWLEAHGALESFRVRRTR